MFKDKYPSIFPPDGGYCLFCNKHNFQNWGIFSDIPQLTIGSCFSVHYRVMEHAGSLESTKEA